MIEELEMTEKELQEVKFALVYEHDFFHGTDGHNRLIVIAKLAKNAGFYLNKNDKMNIPGHVTII